jgi:hypothetical protein
MSKYLEEQEKKAIRLVEERGVAAFPYRTAINDIVKWCRDFCVGMKPGKTKEGYVPTELCKKIDFIENLFIHIKVRDGLNYAKQSGGGSLEVKMSDYINDNGKYNKGIIYIEGFSCFGDLYDRSILNSLCHELNHFYEAWRELTKTRSMGLFARGVKRANVNITSFNDMWLNNSLNFIIYRLFAETEMNAVIAGVYGDLKGFESTREDFSDDIHDLQAYYIYSQIKNNLPEVIRRLKSSSSMEFSNFIRALSSIGIKLNPYNNTKDGYIKEFNRKAKYLLKCLIRGIGRAASLYYDSIEVPEDDINLKIK